MIQTPQTPRSHSDLGFYVVVVALWLLGGAALVGATVLAGGAPHTRVVDWPLVAIRDLVASQGRVAPWRWVGAPFVRSPHLFYSALILVGGIVSAAVVLVVQLLRGFPAVFPFLTRSAPRPRWGGARTLQAAGLPVLPGSRRRRLLLGRHGRHWVAAGEGVSLLALGAPGSGKTAGLCIPAIEDWDGPVVAISDKTDLLEVAAGMRQHRGRVDVLDPARRTGLATCSWSPVRQRLGFDATLDLVRPLVPGDGPGAEAVTQVLTCALYCAANLGRGADTAVAWLDDLSGETLVQALLMVEKRDPRAITWMRRVVERGPEQRAASFSAARGLLRARFELAIGDREPPFRPGDLVSSTAGTLFVIAPPRDAPGDPAVLPALLRVLQGETWLRQQRRPLLLVLDGADAVAGYEPLADHLASRWRRLVVLAACRDLHECTGQPGLGGVAVAERARAVLCLGGAHDEDTLELMHRLVSRQVLRRRGGRAALAQHLLPPEAGRQLGPGRALLVYGGLPPAVLWLRNCYEDPDLVARHREHRFVRGVTAVQQVR